MTKRAIVYALVSTDEQAEHGYSLPSQIEEGRKYAVTHGFMIAAEFREDCSGTIRMSERPQGQRLLEMLERREADSVVVYTSDRLTRSLAHMLLLRDDWRRLGVELHYVNRGKSEDTPENRMTENIEGVFNEYWKEKIVEGSMRGKNSAARAGRLVLSFAAPFGYRKEGKGAQGKLITYEPEARIVRQMFDWYVHGTESQGPLSLCKLADTLNENDTPPPQGKRKGRANRWLTSTLYGMLSNELYAGVTYYGKSRKVQGKAVDQPRESWIRIEVSDLAIIDHTTFEAAQARFKRNRELSLRNSRRRYLLTGHFRCSGCSRVMTGVTKKAGHGSATQFYYRCATSRYTSRQGNPCPNLNKLFLNGRRVEDNIWAWLADLLKNDASILQGLEVVSARRVKEVAPKRKELVAAKLKMDETERELENLISCIGAESNESLRTALQQRARTVAVQRDALVAEHASLTREIEQRILSAHAKDNILSMAREIRRKLNDSPTFERKRVLLDALDLQAVVRIEGDKRLVDVTCGMIEEATTIDLSSCLGTPLSAATHPPRPPGCTLRAAYR